MSERKVITKYYPPDFDPQSIGRVRGPKQVGPKVITVRLMAPFSMRCLQCGEYIYRGRKFNARKETPEERYLGIQIYRFYIRCTRCSAEITFKTDPKNQDYAVERGAKRNTDPWRRGTGQDQQAEAEETDEQRLDRLERERAEWDGEAEEERNAMAELEAKTMDARREMAVADALDEIRTRNARLQRADLDGIEAALVARLGTEDEERQRQEREDDEAARRAFAFARRQEMLEEPVGDDEAEAEAEDRDSAESSASASSSAPTVHSIATTRLNGRMAALVVGAEETKAAPPVSTDMPPPSFKRQVKKRKDHAALLGIKKKPSLV